MINQLNKFFEFLRDFSTFLPYILYLSLYTKATEAYIATRINTHSVYFTYIKDDKLYTYTVELWEFDGTSVERVASQISWTGNNIPYFGGFSISKYEEKYLLVLTDNAGGDISYYGTKDDGSIGLVHELIWKGDAMEGDWYLDDEMISRETYEEYYNKYRSDSIWYGFSEESCNETIQEEISQTKDKLKM